MAVYRVIPWAITPEQTGWAVERVGDGTTDVLAAFASHGEAEDEAGHLTIQEPVHEAHEG